MKKLVILLLIITTNLYSQKKVLDHKDFDIWNRIQNSQISSDGNYIMYSIQRGEEDSFLKIKDKNANLIFEHDRGERGVFSYDSKYAVFTIKEWNDSITEMKRRKVKKDKMPKDTLGIFNLKDKSLIKLSHIKSYKYPEKWSGFIAYTYDFIKKNKKPKDSTKTKEKSKKPSIKNGYPLVIRNLNTNQEDTIQFVTDYTFSKEQKIISYITTGDDNVIKPGV